MIVAEYGAEGFKIGYIYAAAGLGFLAAALWWAAVTIMEEIQYHRDNQTLRELDEADEVDGQGDTPPPGLSLVE